MSVLQTMFQWVDMLWFPLAFFLADRKFRWKVVAYVALCVFVLRLQLDVFYEFGWFTGALPFLDAPVYPRGVIVYSVVIGFYLWLSRYYARINGVIFLAASLMLFFIAFCLSTLIMLL